MKKLIAIVLTAAMAATLLAGCGGAASSSAPAAGSSAAGQAALSGKVATNGSTSMEKVIGALAEAFMMENGGVDVTYDPTGSGAGITAATEGTADIGLSSRGLKESETGLTAITVALDGIAIIVNNNNPIADLTVEQIKGLANGEVTNWKEVGGKDAPVVMIGREAGSGTRDGFESIIDVKDSCKYAQELTATGAIIAAVAANENAIGYASLSAVDDTVKAITVEGVEASETTVQDGSYKVQRPFNFVVKEGAEQSAAVKAFIEFAESKEAADIIIAAGAVPLAK
ncbi:phosphate ABC transporter substrate-binding protein [Pygmaiobacter massiliensis]|uniref:phosphate ABC transporter substrate-binding protein n=1 Tax=Pygmaiobacter massiliensis TaxID=1917873 RepID=UPI002A82EF70|nr:phosphate ABC transporter substrate-binding protein [Pygmaiobacter massiliensis]MDY4784034.1 phosphate ABC transporter substrate-binding protein [Pygmaiobacter massiliensis]